jgi:hypothetical protein
VSNNQYSGLTPFPHDDQSWAAEVIRKNPVRDSTFDHVLRHVDLAAVDEARHDGAAIVQFRHNPQGVSVQELLDKYAVDLLADPAVLPIDDIVKLRPVAILRPDPFSAYYRALLLAQSDIQVGKKSDGKGKAKNIVQEKSSPILFENWSVARVNFVFPLFHEWH